MSAAHAQYSVDQIAQQCIEENARFQREGTSDATYCFELFRRALADLNEIALSRIREIYDSRLQQWVRRLWQYNETNEEVEYFCQEAFVNFYFASVGPKFAKFESLGAILNYMKSCVYSAVRLYMRRRPLEVPLMDEERAAHSETPLKDLKTELLWQHIHDLLTEEDERLLASLVFVLEMKPAEIAVAHPTIWEDARQVSLALYRLRRKIYRDPTIQSWLDDDDAASARI